jgi:predicted AAA+ superfamily ATPase
LCSFLGGNLKRAIESALLAWKNRSNRLPLLLRGARQVGKSFIVEAFGRVHFTNCLTINLELQRHYHSCFDTLDPKEIVAALGLISREPIIPGQTLLFLDEIQECPHAIMALRYFKEKMPELHVIGAGSLLEFALQADNFRMPVGRIQSLYVKPLSYKEFITALGYEELAAYLPTITLNTTLNPAVEEKLSTLLHLYFTIGGMPAVIQEYIDTGDLRQCQYIQSSLLTTYRDDFAKYAKTTQHRYLQRLLEQAPGMVGQNFRYAKVDAEMQSRELKPALEALLHAGIITKIHQTTASGLPLNTQLRDNKFKLLFLDIGLVKASQQLDIPLQQEKNLLLLSRGMLAEQFVGQELLAYADPYMPKELYYWQREKTGSLAEVDYVLSLNEHIIPLEVKAGKTGSLRSVQVFLTEKQQSLGARCSMYPLSFNNRIISIPFYLLSEVMRLLREQFECMKD